MPEKNEIYKANIIDITEDGDGVAKVDSIAVFVKGGVIGDTCNIKITSLKKKYGFGEVIEVLRESEFKVKPLCIHFYECGGCDMQDIEYEKQLEIKTNIVKNAVARIGSINRDIVSPCIGMSLPWKYRNKAVFHVIEGKIGFFAKNSKRLIEVRECPVSKKSFIDIINVIRTNMTKLGNGINKINSIMIRSSAGESDNSVNDRIMIEFRLREEAGLKLISLIGESMLSRLISMGLQSMSINCNGKSRLIYGTERLETVICKTKFMFSATSFLQINHSQGEKLYNLVRKFSDIKGKDILLDIYSGVGTITLIAGRDSREAYGVESWRKAVLDARNNAKENNEDNRIKFFDGMAEKIIPILLEKREIKKPDVVIVDPPRAGCDVEVINLISLLSPSRIVYVSCKPSTLARDLKILEENGFKTDKIQPIDMFAQSVHVECIALIQREKS